MPIYVGNKSTDHQYYPTRPDYKSAPQYSLGSRREEKGGVLTNVTSTTEVVGPNTYLTERVTALDKWKNPASWSFGHGNRQDLYGKTNERYQTYSMQTSMGLQPLSIRKSSGGFKIGNETRDGRQKTGIFKSAMTQPPVKIHIAHPAF